MCQLLEPTQGQLMVTLMQRKLTYFGKYNLGFSWFGYVELAAYLLVWFNPTHSNRSVVPTLHLTKFLSWSKWPRYEWTESRSLSSISNDQGNKVKICRILQSLPSTRPTRSPGSWWSSTPRSTSSCIAPAVHSSRWASN